MAISMVPPMATTPARPADAAGVRTALADGIATVVLDNPRRKNAIGNEAWGLLESTTGKLA